MLEVKAVAVIGGRFGVVENGLIGDGDVKDLAQDEGRFPGGDGAGDMEGQDQPQDIGAVVNAVEIDFGFIRGSVSKGSGLEVIFPVLVA